MNETNCDLITHTHTHSQSLGSSGKTEFCRRLLRADKIRARALARAK